MSVKFGMTGRDVVTGFTGVVIGRADYISGCSQVLLTPRVGEDGKKPDGEWVDIQRVEQVPDTEVILLDNGDTPGCDLAAPKR